MPAQKRPLETATPPSSTPSQLAEDKTDDSVQGRGNHIQEPPEYSCDSDENPYPSGGEKEEFIVVKLTEIRKEVQCPICLGIIRKTRTVMECLHRFCRECIDKSMRLGNNECPACRTHCASRRSLRDDPNYDALIAALYPDIDKYEEEELAFHEEEKARNKLIQDSIAQTFRRQAEALGKKRTSSRVATTSFVRRQGTYHNLRGRRNHRAVENQGSDEEEANGLAGSKDSSSADERSTEIKSKRYKRWGGARSLQPSPGINADGGCDDNDSEVNKDVHALTGLVGCREIPAWGRGGLRSNTRYGGSNGFGSKITRNIRVSKIISRLQSSNKNNEELRINLMLVSLHEEKISSLKRPHLCCSPTFSVLNLCQYVAMQTSIEANEIEIVMMKDFLPLSNVSGLKDQTSSFNPCCNDLQLLNGNQTLGDICSSFTQQNLVLAFRKKV